MLRFLKLLTLISLGLASLPVQTRAADLKPLAIGSPAPEFKLPGVDGQTHGLNEFADSKVLVIAFTCNH